MYRLTIAVEIEKNIKEIFVINVLCLGGFKDKFF